MREERLPNTGVVVAGIATNVLDEHIHTFTAEAEALRKFPAQVAAIYISIDSRQRTDGIELFGHFHRADVASMPDRITGRKILDITFIPIAMGVGQEAYTFHSVAGSESESGANIVF